MSLTIVETRAQSPIRRHIASHLGQSYREVMQLAVRRDVDVSALISAVTRAKTSGDAVTVGDWLVGATAHALRKHPSFNANFTDECLNIFEEVNVGFAVSSPHGLIVPVIKHADRLSLREIAVRRADLVPAVIERRHRIADLADATFTISNLGPAGVDSFDPIVVAPQVGILGVGRIRSLAVDPGSRTMNLSLAFDHRVHDGADAAAFLMTIVSALETISIDAEGRAEGSFA